MIHKWESQNLTRHRPKARRILFKGRWCSLNLRFFEPSTKPNICPFSLSSTLSSGNNWTCMWALLSAGASRRPSQSIPPVTSIVSGSAAPLVRSSSFLLLGPKNFNISERLHICCTEPCLTRRQCFVRNALALLHVPRWLRLKLIVLRSKFVSSQPHASKRFCDLANLSFTTMPTAALIHLWRSGRRKTSVMFAQPLDFCPLVEFWQPQDFNDVRSAF